VFTHCDDVAAKPDDKFIRNKLKALEKYTKLVIPNKNVVLFNKTSSSLEEFVNNMVEGNMNIASDI